MLITVLFFAVGVFVIERHELWFDESQAWLMAKASANIPELFEHLKGERHQILWYLCLFSITRFSHDPFAMQFFHLLIASATVFLIACFAPFPIWIKLPLICSYFFAYEYCVVSRNYALGVFLVFLFCTLNNRETKPVLAQILVLCLLSNTNAFGLLLAIALAATMLFERVLARGKPFSELIAKRNLVLVLVLLLSFSLAIFQLIRVKSWTGTYKDWIRYKCDRPDKKLVATIDTIWRSYVPLPKFSVFSFWNTNLVLENVPKKSIFTLLGVLLFLFWSLIFRLRPGALFLYLTASGSVLCFTFAENIGSLRHYGHLFITLIASCWLYQSKSITYSTKHGSILRLSRKVAPFFNPALCLLLVPQVVAGFYAIYMDCKYTFNGVKEVSIFIKTHKLSEFPLAGDLDTRVSPLTAYLDKQIYYLNYQTFGTFIDWKSHQKARLTTEEVLERVRKFVINQRQPCLLVSTEPILRPYSGLDHKLLFAVAGAIRIEDDKYFVYLVNAKNDQKHSEKTMKP